MNKERDALESMVWQFAYRGVNNDNKAIFTTGGLSALEEAFSALGWDDPKIIEDERVLCDVEGCNEFFSSGGAFWRETGYWKLCSRHFTYGSSTQPKMKEHAIKRESRRDKETGILNHPHQGMKIRKER